MINTKKASQLNDVLTEYIKKFSNVFTPVITDEVIPTTRRANLQKKTNCRPTSILSNISKIYERIMPDNMSDYFNDVLSKFQCGFRKGFGAQNCLLYMSETIQKARDDHGVFTVVIIAFPYANY